jgi:hypothetical protein
MQRVRDHYIKITTNGDKMVTKKVTNRRRAPVPAPASSPSKSFPTAALGLGMVVLTNYQAEVKQILTLLIKSLT